MQKCDNHKKCIDDAMSKAEFICQDKGLRFTEIRKFILRLIWENHKPSKAYDLLEAMQNANIGYLAVSLGYYRTLFSVSGASTSSEIPEEEQKTMGLSPGLIRFSIGLDHDIERTFQKMVQCMKTVGVLKD